MPPKPLTTTTVLDEGADMSDVATNIADHAPIHRLRHRQRVEARAIPLLRSVLVTTLAIAAAAVVLSSVATAVMMLYAGC